MFRVTWPWHTRSHLIFYSVELYLFDIRDPKNLQNKKDHPSSVIRTKDKKGHVQGHATLTYKVTHDSCRVKLYIFDIRDPKNLQNKKKIIALASLEQEIKKVTFRVTWPWRTRSRLIVTVLNYIYLTSVTLKTYKTKKDHRSSVIWTRDKKGHVLSHATLMYKVTLQVYSAVVYLFEILDPKNMQNKKKFIALAFLHPDIFQNVTFSIFWLSGGVKMTSLGVIWRHRSSLWLY